MGPRLEFILQMTKVLLSWPPVVFAIFLISLRNHKKLHDLVDKIADRVKRVSVTEKGFDIETLPRGPQFLTDVPYSERDRIEIKDIPEGSDLADEIPSGGGGRRPT